MTETHTSPDYVSWLARQTDRRDAVGALARNYPSGRWSGLERPLAWAQADAEFRQWWQQEYLRSPEGRSEAERLRVDATRSTGSRSDPDVEPVTAQEAITTLTSVLTDLLEVIEGVVALRDPALQDRPRRALARAHECLRSIRRIRPEYTEAPVRRQGSTASAKPDRCHGESAQSN
jgi:hypothetical protein